MRPFALIGLLAALAPTLTAAQPLPPTPVAQGKSIFRRVDAVRDTTIELEDVQLFVPAGATRDRAVVALGTGGVPGPDPETTGLLVSVSGGLSGAVVAVFPPTDADRSVATPGPALVVVGTGEVTPCLDAGDRWACPIASPGAFRVGGTSARVGDEALLRRALAHPARPASTGGPLAPVLAIVAGAAVLGAGVMWFLSRREHGGVRR